MTNLEKTTLKIGRKIYSKFFMKNSESKPICENDVNVAAELILNLVTSESPCMIARFGATEMLALENYFGVHNHNSSRLKYIRGKCDEWWWKSETMKQMKNWSGFFPPTPQMLKKFSEMMINDVKDLDLLGSWLTRENMFTGELNNIPKIRLIYLDPFWSKIPWTKALEGKKVLVVHPFADSIMSQYTKREHLFNNSDILPKFDLKVLKAVQSLGGSLEYNDWFEALDDMKNQVDKVEYDICLLGCGAYGFPLAAHIKRQGKKAIHIGGSLQLLFGIIGNRWEDQSYALGTKKYCPNIDYPSLINGFWIRPGKTEKIANAQQVEGATYW